MSFPNDKKEPLETEAEWADKSQVSRCPRGSLCQVIGVVLLSMFFLTLIGIAFHFDPILSKPF
ncbi:hypothetical protein FHS20_001344 [Phyllobacterium endophyticum]|nr:hypothetical protein [Phyllobacterium endophyticum]